MPTIQCISLDDVKMNSFEGEAVFSGLFGAFLEMRATMHKSLRGGGQKLIVRKHKPLHKTFLIPLKQTKTRQ